MRKWTKKIPVVVAFVLTATVTAAPSAVPHDVKRVKKQIRKAWGANDRRAIKVAKCESSLDPKAVSPSGKYRGLWQFSVPTWKDYDGPGDDPIEVGARKQTEVAYRLWLDRRWQPWPTCGAKKASSADSSVRGPGSTELRRR